MKDITPRRATTVRASMPEVGLGGGREIDERVGASGEPPLPPFIARFVRYDRGALD